MSTIKQEDQMRSDPKDMIWETNHFNSFTRCAWLLTLQQPRTNTNNAT